MDYHFKRCLEKKSLIKFNIDKNLIKKEIAAAESDLKDSEDVYKIGTAAIFIEVSVTYT